MLLKKLEFAQIQSTFNLSHPATVLPPPVVNSRTQGVYTIEVSIGPRRHGCIKGKGKDRAGREAIELGPSKTSQRTGDYEKCDLHGFECCEQAECLRARGPRTMRCDAKRRAVQCCVCSAGREKAMLMEQC